MLSDIEPVISVMVGTQRNIPLFKIMIVKRIFFITVSFFNNLSVYKRGN